MMMTYAERVLYARMTISALAFDQLEPLLTLHHQDFCLSFSSLALTLISSAVVLGPYYRSDQF